MQINPKIVELDSFIVNGIKKRTKNNQEINPDTAKIAPLWREFQETILPKARQSSKTYGIYYNYKLDHNDEYDLMAGLTDLEGSHLEKIVIPQKKYLCFEKSGEMPGIVFELWQKIWAYFENDACPHKWEYSYSIEDYNTPNHIKIYIAI